MLTEINFLTEDMADDARLENDQADVYFAASDELAVKGDDDEEDEMDDTSGDNPPLNEEVVHSPVTTQPGGKPNS